jgi:polysaccharide export outer membrane protein
MRITVFLLFWAVMSAQTRPAPVAEAGGANLPAQKIRPNDLVAVSVYDAPELSKAIRVSADGYIRLPLLDRPIKADGLLPAELGVAITAALKAEEILVKPSVTVTVAEYHSRPISVVGAVKTPTTFEAIGTITLLEAIARAGGLSQEAGPEILVSRTQPGPTGIPTSLTQRVSVKAFIGRADPAVNLKLVGGEEVRVPEAGKVFVIGNVRKPGAFAVQDSTETTVLKMLAMAEGLTPYASNHAFIIRRDDQAGRSREIPVELGRIMKRQAPDMPLLESDILYVPDRSGRRATLSVLEKLLIFGGGAAAAGIYAGVH